MKLFERQSKLVEIGSLNFEYICVYTFIPGYWHPAKTMSSQVLQVIIVRLALIQNPVIFCVNKKLLDIKEPIKRSIICHSFNHWNYFTHIFMTKIFNCQVGKKYNYFKTYHHLPTAVHCQTQAFQMARHLILIYVGILTYIS